jgi:hypothetical protein
MSDGLLKESSDIYNAGVNYFQSGPWRNYIRDINLQTISVPDGDVGTFDVFVTLVEEELVGYKIKLYFKNVTSGVPPIDIIEKIEFMDSGDNILSTATDTFQLTSTNDSAIAKGTDTHFSWLAPGIGFRIKDAIANTVLQDDVVHTYTALESHLGKKRFDGGVHCWIKGDNGDEGIAHSFSTRPFPRSFIEGSECLLVWNSYPNKTALHGGTYVAMALVLQGSNDGSEWFSLKELMTTTGGIDFTDTSQSIGVSTFSSEGMAAFMFADDTDIKKMEYYRISWWSVSDNGTNKYPNEASFYQLSLYQL